MRPGLTFRVTMSHLLLVLAALAVFIAALTLLTRGAFLATESRVDRAMAQRLAPWLEQYYLRRGSWEGADRILNEAMGAGQLGGPWRDERPMMGRGMSGMMRGDIDVAQPILLVDDSGAVVAAVGGPQATGTQPPGPGGRPERVSDPTAGEPIGPAGDPHGWLFLGSMIPGAGNPLQRVISGTIIRASIISGAVVLVLATLVAAYWSSWLLKPLRALEAASRTLASGDYTARVRVPRGEHELRSLAEGFNAMAEEIGAQESTRRRFVADAAHELRTPVSLLSARIEMLREGVYDPTPEQWDSLQGSVGRLARLVEDLQVLARLDAGRIALDRRPVDAVSFLRELAHEFRPAAGKAGVALSLVEEHTSPPSVLADPVRLHQVMANIVANAVRHTPAGGSVTLRAASQPSPGSVESVPTGADQHVELTVEDTGPGIPREDRERVFDRFVRLDAGRGRDHGGSGLGLAIARRLAELQDGTIRVEGPRLSDSGARFVVTLPADA